MEQQIKQVIAKSSADYTEIRVERTLRSQVFFQKDKLENLETSSEFGGIVRVLKDGGWGIAVFNDISQLSDKVSEATRAAKLVASRSDAPVELAEVPVVQETVRADLKHDFRSVSLKEKKELAETYNKILLSHDKRIVSSQVRYTDSFREVTFANSEGTFLTQEVPDVTLIFFAVASMGEATSSRGLSRSGRRAGSTLSSGVRRRSAVQRSGRSISSAQNRSWGESTRLSLIRIWPGSLSTRRSATSVRLIFYSRTSA